MPGDKECHFSGVTSSGRVWRKAPESDAWSVPSPHTSSLAFRHPSSNICRNFDDIEGSLLVFSHLFTEIAPLNLTLSATSVKLARSVSTKTLETLT